MNTQRLGIVVGMAGLVCLTWAGEARGELPAPFGQTTGAVFEFAFGGNGVTDNDHVDSLLWDADVDPIVGFAVGFYYRPIPYLSVGLHTHYGFLKGEASGMTDEFAGFLGVLGEVRGHLPMSRFDPWVGLGVGYALTHNSGDVNGGGGAFHFNLHGVGIGLGFGVNIFITERLALTPFFRMIFAAWVTACWEYDIGFGNEDDCDDLEDTYNDDVPDMPHLWVVGAALYYIFGGN